MDLATSILHGLAYVLPAYLANSSPVFVGGGPPLDKGKNFFDGRRIFGDHKTIRGFLGGILIGTISGLLLPYIFSVLNIAYLSYIDGLLLALLLSLGAHIGDLLGSFIKRRLNLKPGAPAPFLDQAGFIIFAFIIAYPLYPLITMIEVVIIILITLIVHPVSNIVAYLLGLKDKPW
ncbi:MAG: CDP-2,3-bis-(O-geranylgeranyl)-sn-glycerol synthase [Candidatus Njordarchaeota archaeon]